MRFTKNMGLTKHLSVGTRKYTPMDKGGQRVKMFSPASLSKVGYIHSFNSGPSTHVRIMPVGLWNISTFVSGKRTKVLTI
jgi:2-keto-3-deoxy-6-phosphogluconate aldolase